MINMEDKYVNAAIFQAVQQEKHTLQRHLEVRELEAGQREAELQADIAALRQQFDQKHNQVQ